MPSSYVGSDLGTPTISLGAQSLPLWAASISYALNFRLSPTVANGLQYQVSTAGGSSGVSEPTWPLTVGATVTDGGIIWTCVGTAPQPGVAPTITGPVGTDNRTAASIDISIDMLADHVAYLMKQGPLPGQGTANLQQASVVIPVQAGGAVAHGYRLIWGYAGAASKANQRLFLRDDGVLVFTVNATTRGSSINSWTADNSASPATAYYLGSRSRSISASDLIAGLSIVYVRNPSAKNSAGAANTWSDDCNSIDGTTNSWDGAIIDYNGTTGAANTANFASTVAVTSAGVAIGNNAATGVVAQAPSFQHTTLSGSTPSFNQNQNCIVGITTIGGGTTVGWNAGTFPLAGQILIFKDETGNANVNNITLSPTNGTIDGAATKVINTAYGSLRMYLGLYSAGVAKYYTF